MGPACAPPGPTLLVRIWCKRPEGIEHRSLGAGSHTVLVQISWNHRFSRASWPPHQPQSPSRTATSPPGSASVIGSLIMENAWIEATSRTRRHR